MSRVVDLFHTIITDANNEKLCAEFSEKEISDALFQIGPLKAPGPDGFPARFFQRNWLSYLYPWQCPFSFGSDDPHHVVVCSKKYVPFAAFIS